MTALIGTAYLLLRARKTAPRFSFTFSGGSRGTFEKDNLAFGRARMKGGTPHPSVLHLPDRQVIDVDGLAVCRVDDLELTESGDDALAVTGLLAGPNA